MTTRRGPKRILLVTGMSGAGKTTALKTLEDMGWEVVDNLPLLLLDRLLDSPPPEGATDEERPIAIGIDSRTRGFDAESIVRRIKRLREEHGHTVDTLFLDCSGAELARRFSETRRRHPLALDRPASDGIARERELMGPLRRWADHVVDTTDTATNALQHELRTRFAGREGAETPTLSVMSFGFSRGVPRNADLLFDMRFLRNPHWDDQLRPHTGLDADVAAYIAADPAYDQALGQIESLLELLLPRYSAEGKAYVTIAFGCTGGRHRSVHVAETIAERLRKNGFSPTLSHRDLASTPHDSLEGTPNTARGK
ncbi:RNase adapter RapZ [Flavisphingomonas formosensis]|uniref:RNase adapter RapZ n=1 Tax=Flavisphingomonas formosensis TaxID=861534 RepID=UPI0012FCF878|nr:RNase adapter RapZ [Sphingomonas formosensis]